jgi:S-adenosylmethionine synthetase
MTLTVTAAANRFPNKCDSDPEGTRALNVDATRTLVRAASAVGSFVIYISTDYVFPGREGEAPYEADAPTEPLNFYGQTKLDGEHATLEETAETRFGVILRVPVLYGPSETPDESVINSLKEVVEKAQTSEQGIDMDDWAQRYPTHTSDVARVCKDIAGKYVAPGRDHRTLPKILQFTSEDRMTKYDICKMFAEISGQHLDKIKPNQEGNDPGAQVQRPFDAHLSTKALQDLGIPVWTQDFRGWW